jgi:hypothetical protein
MVLACGTEGVLLWPLQHPALPGKQAKKAGMQLPSAVANVWLNTDSFHA